jgi:predicted MFS family arabinose efflux permease
MTESQENLQLLTFPEEKALVGWITCLTVTGHPTTYTFIREMAEEIRKRCVNQINEEMELVSYPPIGTSWVPTF